MFSFHLVALANMSRTKSIPILLPDPHDKGSARFYMNMLSSVT